ncbi:MULTISPECIES: hypothetical protein [Nocardioides]|uniref:Uncharacterized protein n=1 Tax=Nocardioides vastitatis TaxID=2568655 RepID=A0ABW0ZPL8_9ACTN|nr:hypothetical protein [Nocardioides sp.]THI92788.1 hypothetical protein E7Z54_21615 [Nocardioides sp.]
MSNLTGRQIMLLLGCALALITAAVGVYGLVRGPGETAAESPDARQTEVWAVADPTDAAVGLENRALPHTTDPVAYARAVAVSLFDWDTTAGFLPTDYTSAVLADADPSGEETPGLLADVATYLPTVQQWLDLGAMEVEQTIEVDEAYVPDSWSDAVEQAHGHLRPGTTAVTIMGTRQRTGVWNGEVAESSYPISFTIFVACQPSFERCHVLRLSELDNPLR